MSDVLMISGREYTPAGKVGKHFGYTRDYILTLTREGKVDGKKIGHRWYVNIESVEKFFNESKIKREERRREVSALRREELRNFSVANNVSSVHATRSLEVVAVLLIATIVGVTGYVGFTSTGNQAALSQSGGVSFIDQFAISLYNLISSRFDGNSGYIPFAQDQVTRTPESPLTTARDVVKVGDAGTKTVHTSMVIGPGEVLTTTSIEEIQASFSDEVSVSVDPHNPDTGVIVPYFKNKEGEEYRYLLVPIGEGGP